MKTKLDRKALERLRTQGHGRERIFDARTTGFFARRTQNGQVIFGVRLGPRRARRDITIGPLGPFTLETARAEAERLIAEERLGKDPAGARAKERAALTFGEWAAMYLEHIQGAKRAVRQDRAYLGQAAALWGKMPVDRVTADDVTRFFQGLRGRRTTANRWLASVRACFSEAWRRGLVPENPAMRVRPLPENPPRQRVLSMEELERLLGAVATLADPHSRLALTLLIDTGARLSEVLRAKWEDFDLSTGRWSLKTTKAGRPTTKTLPASTLQALLNTPRIGPYVVAGRDGTKPRSDLNRPWRTVCAKAGLHDVHIHDIRRTFGLEVFRRFGVGAAAKALGHSSPQVTAKVYAPLQADDERAITETIAEQRSNVIRLLRVMSGGEGHGNPGG
jgi:integrase